MKALTEALETQDLGRARRAADQFRDLAGHAPDDIRPDFEDLAVAVADIVELLGDERSAVPGAANPDKGDATTLQQDWEELNRRLDDLASTSSRVERWAFRTCGLDLS